MQLEDLQENYGSGWIRLYRSIKKHWIWQDPIKFQWWIDILLSVNHSGKKVNIGYDIFDCEPGQSIKSLKNWADEWNVSKDTVRNFFTLLKKDRMIIAENLKKTTRITVCNYDDYQSSLHAKQTRSKREANARQTQGYPNKNDKKEKNVKNENNYKTTLLSDLKKSDFDNPKYLDVTIAFFELFKKNLIEAGASTSTLEKSKGVWVDHIRLMYETDKQTSESVKKVFEFLQVDEFWKKNILSTATLRKQFNKLLMNAKNKTNGTTTKQPATSDSELIEVLSKHFD